MTSHKADKNSSLVRPSTDLDRPTDQVIEYQDLYRTSPTAERAFEKYVARDYQHGHDLEDWLASEREIEAEQREREESTNPSTSAPAQGRDGHDGQHRH